MTATVADLTTPRTADQLFALLLAELASGGLPTTSWQTGAVPRTLAKADATALAQLDAVVSDIATAAFLDTATADWLSLFAASRFQVTRTAAVATVGTVRVTVRSGAGPYSIPAGGLLVSDGVRRWRSTNTTVVNITSASPTDITVRAESLGAAYNVASSAITTLVSPALAGVSVVNSASPWITTAGADAESDASLRQRCRDRWSTLGRGATEAAYQYLSRTGHADAAQVTRVALAPPSGDGTVRVYLAGPAGPVDPSVVTTVQAWLDTYSPATDTPTVESAAATSVTVTATDSGAVTATVASASASVTAGSSQLQVSVAVAVALATNTINSTVSAQIDASRVTSAGAVTLRALSTKAIMATNVAVSLAITGGSGQLSLSGAIGVTQLENRIGGSAVAAISNAPAVGGVEGVRAGGGVTLLTNTTSTISAVNVAVSVAASAGSGQLALAFGGAVSLTANTITQTEKNYDRFITELTALTRKYGVAIQSVGGVYLADERGEFDKLTYNADITSGDLYPNFLGK